MNHKFKFAKFLEKNKNHARLKSSHQEAICKVRVLKSFVKNLKSFVKNLRLLKYL